MNLFALLIIVVGFPLSLIGFLLTRAYSRAKTGQVRSSRVSHRADLFNSIGDDEMRALRMASDSAVVAAGIVSGTVIHS